jgi:hypothetical protein
METTIVRAIVGFRVTVKARRFRTQVVGGVLKIIPDLLVVQLIWGLPSLEIS